jgi:anaerobic magnesium-protoporphyrin IX monomethyl ester cyclase
MATVVLVSPPFVADYMRNARCDFVSLSHSSWYPIWLGQAGSWLEAKGHRTRLLDAQQLGLTTEQTLDEIRSLRADLVAVYTGRLSEASDIAFGDAVAKSGPRVAFVGPYTSIDPDAVLRQAVHADLAINREFDLPLEELASGADPSKTPNVHVRDRATGEIAHLPPRPLYRTAILDQFPLTAKYFDEHLDVYRYKTPSEPYPFIDVMSGRGCAWGRCNFCLWVQTFVPGSVYNLRSLDHFMGEFDYVVQQMPKIKSVMVQDDMITDRRAVEISTALLDRGYEKKLRWSCYAKPNSKLKLETLKLMRRSGCLNLHVGFESGDEEVLRQIDKGSTVEQAREFARAVRDADLRLHADFAMGHLGETRESMERTIELAKEIDPHTAQFQIMIPFKGTQFWRQLDEASAWNTAGEPSFENVGGASAEEIRSTAKEAYRRFYVSGRHLRRILAAPREALFSRLDQYVRAVPAVTWRRWVK